MPYELDDKKNLDISPSTSPFDTHNFPTSVNDISTWLDGDKYIFASTEESNQANTSVECDQVSTVTPEIKIKQEINTSTSNYSLHFHLATFHFFTWQLGGLSTGTFRDAGGGLALVIKKITSRQQLFRNANSYRVKFSQINSLGTFVRQNSDQISG